MIEDQSSFISNTNLCQSYLSQASNEQTKKMTQLIATSQELERVNATLMSSIDRYNADLTQYFLENQSLKVQIKHLEQKLSTSKQVESISTQTLLLTSTHNSESQTDDQVTHYISQQKKQCTSQISLKQHTPTTTPKGKNKIKQQLKYSPQPIKVESMRELSATPEGIDMNYEYFESKHHLEKMIRKIQKSVSQLQDDVTNCQPLMLCKTSIIDRLNQLKTLIDFLIVLLDDQLIEIKKFTETIQHEANEMIEEAKLMNMHILNSQMYLQQKPKMISYTEFPQNSSYCNSNPQNSNNILESFIDSNITIINTSNTDNLSQEDSSFSHQPREDARLSSYNLCNSIPQNKCNSNGNGLKRENKFRKNLQELTIDENCFNQNPQDLNRGSNQLQNLQEESKCQSYENYLFSGQINSALRNEGGENNIKLQRSEKEQVQKQEIEEIMNAGRNHFFQQQQIKQEQQQQLTGEMKEQIRLNQTGTFLSGQNQQEEQQFDNQSQGEDLLETLGEEEFDFDQGNKLLFNSNELNNKKNDFKSQKERINRIMTFSFGVHPLNQLNYSQTFLMKQSKQIEEEAISAKEQIVSDYENKQKQLQTQLQYSQKSFIDFLNSIQKLFQEPELKFDIEGDFDQAKQDYESKQIKTNAMVSDCQQQILQKLTKLQSKQFNQFQKSQFFFIYYNFCCQTSFLLAPFIYFEIC